MRPDPAQLEALRGELVDAGLWELLADPDSTDVMVNESGEVFVELPGRGGVAVGRRVEADRLEAVVATLAGLLGRVVHRERPILEGSLPWGAVRVEAVLPPIVEAPVVTFRKPPARAYTLADLEGNGTLSAEARAALEQAVRERTTGVIAGGVGSGKTTLLTAILHEVVAQNPAERLVVCEEGARELIVPGANVVRLLTSDDAGVDLRRLLRTALRLNPDRIVVGEARGAEALEWLKAANTGHPGGWLTVHANSAEEAVDRLDDLAQEAGVPSQRQRIVREVGLLVFLAKEPGGGRRVREVVGPQAEPARTAARLGMAQSPEGSGTCSHRKADRTR